MTNESAAEKSTGSDNSSVPDVCAFDVMEDNPMQRIKETHRRMGVTSLDLRCTVRGSGMETFFVNVLENKMCGPEHTDVISSGFLYNLQVVNKYR